MLHKLKIFIAIGIVMVMVSLSAHGKNGNQEDVSALRNYQMNSSRVSHSFATYDNALRNEFKAKGLHYPADNILIRTFKGQNELEIWVKNNNADTFTLFKLYVRHETAGEYNKIVRSC